MASCNRYPCTQGALKYRPLVHRPVLLRKINAGPRSGERLYSTNTPNEGLGVGVEKVVAF